MEIIVTLTLWVFTITLLSILIIKDRKAFKDFR